MAFLADSKSHDAVIREREIRYTDAFPLLQISVFDGWQEIWNEWQALRFAYQIADGMVSVCFGFVHFNSQAYISHCGFVHRDLAARNVLVKNDIAKVLFQ